MDNESEEIALGLIQREIAYIFGAAGLEAFRRHGGSLAVALALGDFKKRVEAEQQRKDHKEMWERGYEPVVNAFLTSILKRDLIPNPERMSNVEDETTSYKI